MTRNQIRKWLLAYAWNGTTAEQAAEVECILAQDGWKHHGALAEKFRGQAEDPDTNAPDEFALSSLYECHDGPHLSTCPNN